MPRVPRKSKQNTNVQSSFFSALPVIKNSFEKQTRHFHPISLTHSLFHSNPHSLIHSKPHSLTHSHARWTQKPLSRWGTKSWDFFLLRTERSSKTSDVIGHEKTTIMWTWSETSLIFFGPKLRAFAFISNIICQVLSNEWKNTNELGKRVLSF